MNDSKSIIWIGCYPAHYMRKMQCEVEKERPCKVFFLYTVVDQSNLTERAYETGELPSNSKVIYKKDSLIQTIQFMRSINPSMIVVAGYNNRFLFAALLWARITGRKFCFMSDTNLLDALSQNYLWKNIKKLFLSRLLLHAYKLLYIGARNRDYYLWLIGRKNALAKLFAFPYPAILVEEEKNTGLEFGMKKLQILYVGRLEPIKAIGNLIQSVSLLSKSTRNSIHVELYGDGSEYQRLVSLTDKLGLNEVVNFNGAIKSDNLQRAYESADIFILPSEREPWGVVVNEAMSAGIPVMCPFWVGAAADLIIDGVTGYLLDDNTPQALASGIERGLEQREKLTLSGKRAREIVREGPWNQKAVTRRFISLMDE